MHIPDDSHHQHSNQPLDQWAHLEANSDCMADDLAHQVEPEDTALSVKARLLGLCIALVIVTLLLLAAIFSIANLEEPPNIDSPATYRRAYP